MGLKEAIRDYNVTHILGYLRKSRQDIEREKRTGEDTLTEQKELMNKVLMSIELPYEIKQEVGSGENIEGRPVFQEVLKELENGKYQAVAVKELSRLSRGNYSDAGKIIELISEKRIVIITPYKVYDPRNTMDMKQIRFELFLAREEYEMIKERMVGARYTYAAQGKWVAGSTPYGYSYNKRTQRLKADEEQAKTIQLIYDLFLNGMNGQEVSYQAIATYLSNIGIRTARGNKNWSYTQIKTILQNDVYIGTIKFRMTEELKNGTRLDRPESEHIVVEEAHEPIIDKETWFKVQEKIQQKLPQPHNPLNFSPNELASVCVCANCGGKLIRNCQTVTYEKKDGTESKYVKEFLKCLKGTCFSVKYRDVEEAILDYLSQVSALDNDKLQKHLDEMVKNKTENHGTKSKNQMLDQIEQKEKELKNRMTFIFDKFEQGIYSDEIFIQRKEAIDNEMKELEKSKSELTRIEKDISKEQFQKIKVSIKTTLDQYKETKNKERKNILLRDTFEFVTIELLEKGRGRKPAKFQIIPILRYSKLL